jgi:hypothetical protein
MLSQVRAQFMAGVKPTCANVVVSNYIYGETIADATDFFNNNTIAGGVSYYAGAPLDFSTTSMDLILHGNGATQLGVLTDLYTGSGVAYLLQLTDPSLINATSIQLSNLKNFLTNFTLQALGAQVSATQATFFYTQWVSSGITTPTDINMDGIPDLELATNNTGISPATAALLWNSTSSTSVASSKVKFHFLRKN